MARIPGFERQPYATELEIEILKAEEKDGSWVATLDDTILYPEGGGQPSDYGWLGGVEVREVQKDEAGPLHILVAAVEPGPARLVLDWPRRYDHMQQHTAQHVVTRTALDRFGWATRSFHIGPAVSDIELDCPPPSLEQIEALENAVAEVVVEARPIRAFRVSEIEYAALEVRSRGLPAGHHGDIRLVEIEDFDLNTCGGTHLASTAEIETVKVVGSEAIRGGCRLFWVAGKRVRTRLAVQERTLGDLRNLLDTGDSELISSMRLKMEQLQQARKTQRWLEKRLSETLAETLVAQDREWIDLHLEAFEAGLLRPIAEHLTHKGSQKAAFLTAETGDGALFALVKGGASDFDLQRAGRGVAEILEGRGGGAGQVFQGKAQSLTRRSAAVALLQEILTR